MSLFIGLFPPSLLARDLLFSSPLDFFSIADGYATPPPFFPYRQGTATPLSCKKPLLALLHVSVSHSTFFVFLIRFLSLSSSLLFLSLFLLPKKKIEWRTNCCLSVLLENFSVCSRCVELWSPCVSFPNCSSSLTCIIGDGSSF